MGLATDEPLAITRMNYADASTDRGDTTWALYAPYSILPLWNDEGRTDRAVMGGTAAPGADSLCASAGRCAYVAFDRGEFPFARSGSYDGVWQGTLLVDKADATGTYYRRNRSYDPNTARFTQEDPIGLAGGLNVYGFASGDPVDFSDPFGLKVCFQGSPSDIESLKTALERATNTSITLKGNCIQSYSAARGSKGFENIQEGLGALVESLDEYTVTYSRISSEYDPVTKSVQLFQDWKAYAYPALVKGVCKQEAVEWQEPGQIIAHELNHAYRIGLHDAPYITRHDRAHEEQQAMIWENTYNAAHQLPGRCAY